MRKPAPSSRPIRPFPIGPSCFRIRSLSRHFWTACFITVWSSTCGATATGFVKKSERRWWKWANHENRVAHFSRSKMVHFEKTVDKRFISAGRRVCRWCAKKIKSVSFISQRDKFAVSLLYLLKFVCRKHLAGEKNVTAGRQITQISNVTIHHIAEVFYGV